MNRRDFILTAGSFTLGSSYILSQPSIGIEFSISSIPKKDPGDLSSILINFEEFTIKPKYLDESKDGTLQISIFIENHEKVSKSKTLSMRNGETIEKSDISEILPISIDKIQTDKSVLDGSISIDIDHPSVSDSYQKYFSISGPDGLIGKVLDDFKDNKLSSRSDFGSLSLDILEPSSSKYRTLDRPDYTVDAGGISIQNQRAEIIDNGASRMRSPHGVDLTSNNLTWEYDI